MAEVVFYPTKLVRIWSPDASPGLTVEWNPANNGPDGGAFFFQTQTGRNGAGRMFFSAAPLPSDLPYDFPVTDFLNTVVNQPRFASYSDTGPVLVVEFDLTISGIVDDSVSSTWRFYDHGHSNAVQSPQSPGSTDSYLPTNRDGSTTWPGTTGGAVGTGASGSSNGTWQVEVGRLVAPYGDTPTLTEEQWRRFFNTYDGYDSLARMVETRIGANMGTDAIVHRFDNAKVLVYAGYIAQPHPAGGVAATLSPPTGAIFDSSRADVYRVGGDALYVSRPIRDDGFWRAPTGAFNVVRASDLAGGPVNSSPLVIQGYTFYTNGTLLILSPAARDLWDTEIQPNYEGEILFLAPAGPVIPNGTGTLTATASMSGSGRAIHRGSGALSASASLNGSGRRVSRGSGSISATVTLAGTGQAPVETYSGEGHLAATASLSGTGQVVTPVFSGTGDLSATATLAGSGQAVAPVFSGTGALSATVVLAGSGRIPPIIFSGTGQLDATAALSGQGRRVSRGTGQLDATVALDGTGLTVRRGSGSLSAAVVLAGDGAAVAPVFSGTGHLTAVVTLVGLGNAVGGEGTGTGHLTAVASLTGTGRSIRRGAGALTASVVLLGDGSAVAPVFSGSGALVAASTLFGQGFTRRGGSGALAALVALLGHGRNPLSVTAEIWNGTAWVGMDTYNGTDWVTAEVWNHVDEQWQPFGSA